MYLGHDLGKIFVCIYCISIVPKGIAPPWYTTTVIFSTIYSVLWHMLFGSIAKSLLFTYFTDVHQIFILRVGYWLIVLKKHNINVHIVV